MSPVTPRLRMFAGPNGSGKSTLKSVLIPELLGVYLNPDEIEAVIRQTGCLRTADFGVRATDQDIIPFFAAARLLVESQLQAATQRLIFKDGRPELSRNNSVEPRMDTKEHEWENEGKAGSSFNAWSKQPG